MDFSQMVMGIFQFFDGQKLDFPMDFPSIAVTETDQPDSWDPRRLSDTRGAFRVVEPFSNTAVVIGMNGI